MYKSNELLNTMCYNLYVMRKYLILWIILLVIAGNDSVYSQNEKLSRKEKRELRKAREKEDFEKTNRLLESKKFVFVAEHIQAYLIYGTPYSNTNYFIIDSANIYMQFRSFVFSNGYKFSGFALEKKMSDWKLEKHSGSNTFTVTINVPTSEGNLHIVMDINSIKEATVTIYSTWEVNPVIVSGKILTNSEAKVFKRGDRFEI